MRGVFRENVRLKRWGVQAESGVLSVPSHQRVESQLSVHAHVRFASPRIGVMKPWPPIFAIVNDPTVSQIAPEPRASATASVA